MTTELKDFNKRKAFTVANVRIATPESAYPDIDCLRPF